MTDTLQLSSECLEQWRAMHGLLLRNRPASAPTLYALSALLRRARKFELPNGGRLTGHEEPWPFDLTHMLRPEGDCPIALEYTATPDPARVQATRATTFDTVASSKRIALAWHYDGTLPAAGPGAPPAGSGLCLVSISFADAYGMWAIPFGGHFFEYGAPMTPATMAHLSSHQLELVRAGRMKADALGYAYPTTTFVLDRQAYLDAAIDAGSPKVAEKNLAYDLADEENAYLSFCLALHRGRAGMRDMPVDAVTRRNRIAAGHVEPFDVTRVLPLNQEGVQP